MFFKLIKIPFTSFNMFFAPCSTAEHSLVVSKVLLPLALFALACHFFTLRIILLLLGRLTLI